jgi:hypothetical protein
MSGGRELLFTVFVDAWYYTNRPLKEIQISLRVAYPPAVVRT